MSDDEDGRSDDGVERIDKASQEYQAKFDLPHDEILVDTFLCALQKTILHQGRMYVSQHYICFYSNILLSEAKLVIRADRIDSIELAKVLIFPTAIRVTHSGGVESLFASFLARDKCYQLLQQISRGDRIGRQLVKSSRELDRAMLEEKKESNHHAATPIKISSSYNQSTKHQQLLKQSKKKIQQQQHEADEDDGDNEDDRKASSSSSSSSSRKSKRDTSKSPNISPAKDSSQPQSTLSKIADVLTSVHISTPPPTRSNAISTMHGVVVVASDPRAILPKGTQIKHVRTGSVIHGGVDGPNAAFMAGSPQASYMTQAGQQRQLSARKSSPPMAHRKPSDHDYDDDDDDDDDDDPRDRRRVRSSSSRRPHDSDPRSSIGSTRSRSDDTDGSMSGRTKSSASSSSSKNVALVMKPRKTTTRKQSRVELTDEDEE